MIPIDLKSIALGRYRFTLDESASFEPGGKKDPWYQVIPCRYGQFYPFSAELIAFHCTAGKVRDRLHKEHPCLRCHNWSDDGEAIFVFDLRKFALVAAYARPRQKRRITKSERLRLAELSQKYSPFASVNEGRRDQESTIPAQAIPEVG